MKTPRNERTSKRIAKIAAKVLAIKIVNAKTTVPGTTVTWADIRALAASALTQAADREKYDDIGFDPRDGSSGEPERQWVPVSKQARKAMRGKLGKARA